ncbi:MAG: hypothetical protein PHE55_00230 [Methylococcaceae bacterium]|nr:hypothetical protein [Methylococcaceae bacterium]
MATRKKISLLDLASSNYSIFSEPIEFSKEDVAALEGFGANQAFIARLARIAEFLCDENFPKPLGIGERNDALKQFCSDCSNLATILFNIPIELRHALFQWQLRGGDFEELACQLQDMADEISAVLEYEPPDPKEAGVKLHNASWECVAAKQVCKLLQEHGFRVGYSEGVNAKTPSLAQIALSIVFHYGGRNINPIRYIKMFLKEEI